MKYFHSDIKLSSLTGWVLAAECPVIPAIKAYQSHHLQNSRQFESVGSENIPITGLPCQHIGSSSAVRCYTLANDNHASRKLALTPIAKDRHLATWSAWTPLCQQGLIYKPPCRPPNHGRTSALCSYAQASVLGEIWWGDFEVGEQLHISHSFTLCIYMTGGLVESCPSFCLCCHGALHAMVIMLSSGDLSSAMAHSIWDLSK